VTRKKAKEALEIRWFYEAESNFDTTNIWHKDAKDEQRLNKTASESKILSERTRLKESAQKEEKILEGTAG